MSMVALEWNWLAHGAHLLGLAALAVAAMGFARQARWGAAVWGLAGAGLLAPTAPQFLPDLASPPQGCGLSALTFNTKLTRGPTEALIAPVVIAHPADIVFLEETVRPEALANLILAAPAFAGYQTAFAPDANLTILSRFPLSGRHGAMFLSATAQIEGQAVTLASTIGSRDHHDNAPAVLLQKMGDALAAVGAPVMIGADLNAGPLSEPAMALTDRFDDAFASAGFGFGATFAAPGRRFGALGPLLRIDYLLTSRPFTARHADVVADYGGSTHFPLRAEFVFAGHGKNSAPCQP